MLRWHCAVNHIVNKLIACCCKGLHMFSKCPQVSCHNFGGNIIATAGFLIGWLFLAHCSCGCSRINSNAHLHSYEMFATILTQMAVMINHWPTILVNMVFSTMRAIQHFVFQGLHCLRFDLAVATYASAPCFSHLRVCFAEHANTSLFASISYA